LSESEKQKSQSAILTLAKEGSHVLGVGQSNFKGDNFLKEKQEYKFKN
jgi:hypothetical protein